MKNPKKKKWLFQKEIKKDEEEAKKELKEEDKAKEKEITKEFVDEMHYDEVDVSTEKMLDDLLKK